MSTEYQELYCTGCGKMLRFKTKPDKNGKLRIICDYCGHQHCRVVINGEITEDRWAAPDVSAPTEWGVERNSE